MPVFHKLDANGMSVDAVVAPDIGWVVSRLGGMWAEDVTGEAGIGKGYDPAWRDFADPWVQPTGAQDAYPIDAKVFHNGRVWLNLTAANVWEPGVSGWRDTPPDGSIPPWTQPTGAHDIYNTGDQVTHRELVWVSDIDANSWEPGVYGWSEVV